MSRLDQAAPVRAGESLDAGRLGDYLASRVPGFQPPLAIRQFPSGFSNLTYLLAAGPLEYVLRRPPFGTRPKSGHDMGREYRVLSALQGVFPESPRPIHYCEDESVIGAPFYLAERIRGIILRRDYPPGLAALPALVRTQQHALIDTLARLHAIDVRTLRLADFGSGEGYVRRQVEGWSARYASARTGDAADAEPIASWLASALPAETAAASLIHNDYKLDNVVFDEGSPERLVGVLDWEMATVGDPWMDVGCSLAYWTEASDPPELLATRMLPTHLPGSLSRAEVLARYAAARGLAAPDFRFYRVFGLFRLAGIVQQIYCRWVHGQTRDPRFAALGPMARVLIGQAGAEAGA
jgi:aminoglycoside phosphotransferase (APT) family kinase protein